VYESSSNQIQEANYQFRLFLDDKLTDPSVIPVFLMYYSAALDSMGKKMEVTKYTEKLVPSTRFVAVEGVGAPKVNEMSFVAPSASVIGDVTVGKESRYVAGLGRMLSFLGFFVFN